MAVELLRRHRFTVDEYYRMVPAGLLREDDRVELIDGEIIEMTPIGSPHAGTVTRLIRHFSGTVGDAALVSAQNPVRLSDLSEPEPDLMLLRPRSDAYTKSHPGPADVLLVVEVSDSSLAYDRDVKVPLYSRHELGEVWIVDLSAQVILVYRHPGPDGYADVSEVHLGSSVAPLALPAHGLDTAALFGS